MGGIIADRAGSGAPARGRGRTVRLVIAVDGLRIQVDGLEALDGTPVIDVKPVLDSIAER